MPAIARLVRQISVHLGKQASPSAQLLDGAFIVN